MLNATCKGDVMKKQEIIKVEKPEIVPIPNGSVDDLISKAIAGKADLAQLEKLLALKERFEANEAKKVFASSFAIVQANIASVAKTKSNPQTHSKYAGLDGIIESAKPIYTKEGFSIIFYEGQSTAEGCIRICSDVLHTAGHKETYYYDVPLDGVGIKGNANMTKIHGKASSTSYGRRYLMCMIWNIPTGDDDDGNAAGKPAVSQPQAKSATIPQNKPETGQGGTQGEKPMPTAPTQEQTDMMVTISEQFKASTTQIGIDFIAKEYRIKISALPESCKQWLRDRCVVAQTRIEKETMDKLNEQA